MPSATFMHIHRGASSDNATKGLSNRCWTTQPRFSIFSLITPPGGRFPLADTARFSVNERVLTTSRDAAAAQWKGHIISGRYAQTDDPHQGAAERLTYIPKSLRQQPDYPPRAGLPHHNEIAVDDATRDSAHRLYMADASYQSAFKERVTAAEAHIKHVYASWAGR